MLRHPIFSRIKWVALRIDRDPLVFQLAVALCRSHTWRQEKLAERSSKM